MNDMDRGVWCILGLPFDAVNLNDTIEQLHDSANNKTSCFISTPNLNFVVECQTNSEFRNSVINSNLSVADGKPVVWIAKLLGVPISERVAGSDLIEALVKNKRGYTPLKLFFFGGEEGVAESACKKLNTNNRVQQCAGFISPGFGSVEDMSSGEIINRINESNADFIIVSLGAKKGQEWIERNKAQITVPIVSHLGAVVNFVAGTVKRAPKYMQKSGLEWLWRIKEEPSLWKRYFFDALSFAGLIVFKVVPLYILIKRKYPEKDKRIGEIKKHIGNDKISINLHGYFGYENIVIINDVYTESLEVSGDVEIQIDDNSYIDAAFIAKTMIFKGALSVDGRNLKITTKSRLITNILRYNCCEYFLT